jgi:hypothetical protein
VRTGGSGGSTGSFSSICSVSSTGSTGSVSSTGSTSTLYRLSSNRAVFFGDISIAAGGNVISTNCALQLGFMAHKLLRIFQGCVHVQCSPFCSFWLFAAFSRRAAAAATVDVLARHGGGTTHYTYSWSTCIFVCSSCCFRSSEFGSHLVRRDRL